MFAPVFLVTAVKEVKRFGKPNKYTGSTDARQMAWNVHLIDGYFKDFSYDLYFDSEDQADTFSPFEIVGQKELIDASPGGDTFVAGETYRISFSGTPNPYTGVRQRQDAWRISFSGGYSGLKGIEFQFPVEGLASRFRTGQPYSLKSLFGTLPAIPVNVAQRLRPAADKARLARAAADAAQKIVDEILAQQEAQKQADYVAALAEAADDTAAAFKSYQDTQALYNLDPTTIMLAFLNQARAGYLLGDDAGEAQAGTAWANANAQYQADLAEKAEDTDAAHQYYRNTIDLYNLDPTAQMLAYVNAAKAGWLLGDDAGETQAGQAYSSASSQYLADVAAEAAQDKAAALKSYQDTVALYNLDPTAQMLAYVNAALAGWNLGDDAGETAAAQAYANANAQYQADLAAAEEAQDTAQALQYYQNTLALYNQSGQMPDLAGYVSQALAGYQKGGDAGELAAAQAYAAAQADVADDARQEAINQAVFANAPSAGFNLAFYYGSSWHPVDRGIRSYDHWWSIVDGGSAGYYDGIFYAAGTFGGNLVTGISPDASALTLGGVSDGCWFGTYSADGSVR